MSWAAVASIGGAVIGKAISGSGGGGQSATTEQKREPWAPAQPYITDNLKRGQELQNFYEKTPFNPQQIQNYSNLFADTNNFRNNTMPGLMDFANKGMTSSYQRQTGGAPGSGGGYGGAVRPGGLLQGGPGAFAHPVQLNGQVGQPNGLLDLNGAQNPFATANRPPPQAAVDPLAGLDPETLAYIKQLMEQKKLNDSINYRAGGLGEGDIGNGGPGDFGGFGGLGE